VLSIRFFRPAFVHVAEKEVPVPRDMIMQPPVDLEQALIPSDSNMKMWIVRLRETVGVNRSARTLGRLEGLAELHHSLRVTLYSRRLMASHSSISRISKSSRRS